MTSIGIVLKNNNIAKILEIIIVLFSASFIYFIARPFVGANPIMLQTVAWITNAVMLLLIWMGLRFRNQGWQHFGLSLKNINLRSVLLSFVVFIAALLGFVIGSIIMANITGIPGNADMSSYNYLKDNIFILIGVLISVFIISSFGEEVIYRAFLITRISEIDPNNKLLLKFAVIISSIIFGLIHFEWGPMGIVQTGFMGLALAISFILVKRNLWILIFAHAYMDAILLIQMYLK
jgi:membrane protease YdiL (CAAX protease family)